LLDPKRLILFGKSQLLDHPLGRAARGWRRFSMEEPNRGRMQQVSPTNSKNTGTTRLEFIEFELK
jgi:hypothetical protein